MQLLRQSPRRGFGALLLLGALAACDTTEPTTPTSIQPVGSAALSGRAGQVATPAPTVQVLNEKGNPLSNQSVTFTVTAGGGTVAANTVPTDANGQATTVWTLGRTVGVQSITAQVGSLPAVTFLATVTPGVPAAVAVSAGNNQTSAVGTTVSTRPAVVVRDAGGNPVQGIEVSFTVSGGNGTITGGTATTDASGVAAVGSWQLGTTAGANTLTATVLGTGVQGNPVVFTATGTAGSAARIEAQPLASATGTAGAALPANNLPTVVVRDANGNPVANAPVTFSVLSGGGTVTGAAQTTNASGIATVGGVTLGNTAGLNTIAATGPGAGQVTFAIAGTAGAPSNASIVTTTNNQRVQAGNPLPVGPSVLVVDRFGNPVPGVQVTFAVATGGGSVIGANGGAAQTTTATTNANGVATVSGFTLGPTPGTNTLVARIPGLPDVTLTAVGLPGAPATLTKISGDSAVVQAFRTTQFVVEVRDAAGNVIGDQPVTFAVTGGSGGSVSSPAVTNASGRATATFTANGTIGVTQVTASVNNLPVINFIVTTAQNTPASATVVQGQGQTATAGGPVPLVPTIQVRDAFNNPVPGVVVRFRPFLTSGGGSSQVQFDSVQTDANGRANPGYWILSPTPGTNQLSAIVIATGVAPIVFSANGVAIPPGATITPQTVIAQTVPVSSNVPVLPSVVVRDVNGNPIAGATVEFRVTGSGSTVNGAGIYTTVTNAAGVATVPSWVVGPDVGVTYSLTAQIVGGAATTFTATTQ